MNLRRSYLCSLLSLCLCFVTAFTSYASIASASESVKSWQEAVDEVKAQRETASASEADLIMMDMIDDDHSVSTYSSVGTVENTVDRTGISVILYNTDRSKSVRTYFNSDGSLKSVTTDFDIAIVDFVLLRTALPSIGNYYFSFDFSSDFSYDLEGADKSIDFYSDKLYANAQTGKSMYFLSPSQYTFMSGDLYISPISVSINGQNFYITIRPSISSGLRNFGGSCRFNFRKTNDTPVFSSVGSSSSDIQADYQSGVTSGLSNIGDTLEEIVETISMQLDALWNQLYNYMHLPQIEKLEAIRQAIENIRLDVDVDNQDVVNKLDEQIRNDNANTQRVEQAVEKHGNFIIDGLKSLFIPDEQYFSGLFDRLHQFFSERLGFLYVPFDLLIRLLDAIKDADTAFAGIPFPGIRAGEWVLVEPMTVTFDILNEFPEMVQALHFITSVVMIGAFINLLHRKMEEVMSR